MRWFGSIGSSLLPDEICDHDLRWFPGGRSFGLDQIERIDLVPLKEPRFKGLAADAIVADLHSDLPAQWESFIARAALKGIPVYHAKQIAESLTGKVEVEHLSENTFGSVIPSLIYTSLKRLLDLVGVVICGLPFLLVIGVAAIAIKLEFEGKRVLCPGACRLSRTGLRDDQASHHANGGGTTIAFYPRWRPAGHQGRGFLAEIPDR